MTGHSGIEKTQSAIQEVITSARKAIETAKMGYWLTLTGRHLLPAGNSDDYQACEEQLTRSRNELATLQSIFQNALMELTANMDRQADAERFGDVWWQRRVSTIEQAEPGAAQEEAWLRAFVEGLLAGRYDVCRDLAEAHPLPGDSGIATEVRASAEALLDGRLDASAAGLRTIFDLAGFRSLDSAQRVGMLVFYARNSVTSADDRADAERRLASQSHWLESNDPALGQLHATMGELALADGDDETAERHFTTAVRWHDPSGSIGMGLLDELHERWSAAKSSYDEAIRNTSDLDSFGKLGAPAPANLYWRLAKYLVKNAMAAEALVAIDRAIQLGVTPAGGASLGKAYVDRARILEKLGHTADAAAAYFQAAERLHESEDFPTARAHLDRACSLDPTVPTYHWLYSDVLRMLANRPDGTLDNDLLEESISRWHQVPSGVRPGRYTAWAYGSLALSTAFRHAPKGSERSSWWHAAALFEQALMLDPHYSRGWGLLAKVHNTLGNISCALLCADRALEGDSSDLAGLEQQAAALMSQLRISEARDAVARRKEVLSDAHASYLDSYINLFENNPNGALAALESSSLDENVIDFRYMRGLCFNRAENREAALTDFRWVVENARRDKVGSPEDWERDFRVMWSLYETGDYDTAERLIRAALDYDSVQRSRCFEILGLTLLARGEAGRSDLAEGGAALEEGIAHHADLDVLTLLGKVELPQLLERIKGQEHESEVTALNERLQDQIEMRLTGAVFDAKLEMRVALAGADGSEKRRQFAARAALARSATSEGQHQEALNLYRSVVGEFVEVREEIVRTMRTCIAEADLKVSQGDVDDACKDYGLLAKILEQSIPLEGRLSSAERQGPLLDALNLRVELLGRMGLASILLGNMTAARRQLSSAWELIDGYSAQTPDMESFTRSLLRDVAKFWRLRDGVIELRHRPGLAVGAAGALDRILTQLSLDSIYRTGRDDLDSGTTFPLINPVIELDDALIPDDVGDDWILFRQLLSHMRGRLEEESGVTVPGIRVRGVIDLPSRGYRILIEDVELGRFDLQPDAAELLDGTGGLSRVVADLQQVLADNLSRLFLPDDLSAWTASASPEILRSRRVRRLLDNREDRLRLHRIMRLLLREQISIADRDAVLLAVAGALSKFPSDTVQALAAARVQLAQTLPGWQLIDDDIALLPQDLEDALATGLTAAEGGHQAQGTSWEMPVGASLEVLKRIRAWYSTGPMAGGIIVHSPVLRPFLWRLLTTWADRVTVITTEELEAARRESTESLDKVGAQR